MRLLALVLLVALPLPADISGTFNYFYACDSGVVDCSAGARMKAAEGIAEDVGAGGASTGYLTRDWRGKNADVPVYSFDTNLFQAMMKLREQLAKELGQWAERAKVDTTTVNADITREALMRLSPEELEQYEALVLKAMGLAAAASAPAAPALEPTYARGLSCGRQAD